MPVRMLVATLVASGVVVCGVIVADAEQGGACPPER